MLNVSKTWVLVPAAKMRYGIIIGNHHRHSSQRCHACHLGVGKMPKKILRACHLYAKVRALAWLQVDDMVICNTPE